MVGATTGATTGSDADEDNVDGAGKGTGRAKAAEEAAAAMAESKSISTERKSDWESRQSMDGECTHKQTREKNKEINMVWC